MGTVESGQLTRRTGELPLPPPEETENHPNMRGRWCQYPPPASRPNPCCGEGFRRLLGHMVLTLRTCLDPSDTGAYELQTGAGWKEAGEEEENRLGRVVKSMFI